MTYPSVGGSADVEVYANWALILVRMTHALVGADPCTISQNKIHPAVAEPEFTPLDLSYMSRPRNENAGDVGHLDNHEKGLR
jgi:hypothetical protein